MSKEDDSKEIRRGLREWDRRISGRRTDAIDVRPEIRDDAPAVSMTIGEARKPGGILDALARIAKKKGPLA